jgi:hypothetical protein
MDFFGETPETMLSMLDEMPMLFHRNKREEHKLSPRNRVLLYHNAYVQNNSVVEVQSSDDIFRLMFHQ